MNLVYQGNYHSATKDTCERQFQELLQKVTGMIKTIVFKARGSVFKELSGNVFYRNDF